MTNRNCECGAKVRLGATRIKGGVMHYIEHAIDERPDCYWLSNSTWITCMKKPYPKEEADRAYVKMLYQWNNRPGTTKAPSEEGASEGKP